MRCVAQRVKWGRVTVDGTVRGEIGRGLLAYIGAEAGDSMEDISWIASKLSGLRIFEDGSGKMNLDVKETGGAVLVISQFTLLGDCRKGRRPSFDKAEAPKQAKALCDSLVKELRGMGITVAEGEFQAHMEVESLNDGPVTMLLDSRKTF